MNSGRNWQQIWKRVWMISKLAGEAFSLVSKRSGDNCREITHVVHNLL